MTQGERVREARKALGLTLEKFGERIKAKKNTISQIENGINGLTDQMALSICREFNVSEKWLKTGEGEMFVDDSDDELVKIVSRLYKDKGSARYKMSLELCRTMEKMTDEQLIFFKDFVMRMAEAAKPEKED